MKKRFKALITVSVILLTTVFLVLACSPAEENRTKYVINAVYDADKKHIDATVTVSYVNNSEIELKEVMFHLYPRAFREDAAFSPITQDEKIEAYPEGVSYGDMTVLKVSRDGVEQSIKIVGEDEDILRVEGALLPTSTTVIEIEFMLDLPTIRHRFGWCDDVANLGNWYPIACVVRNGEFDTTPYYANGDPFNSDIADYEVSISVPQKYSVATSGRQTVNVQNGQKTVTSILTRARDTAAVIGEFKVISKVQNGVEIKYYYQNDQAPSRHLTAAADSLATFSELFGDYAYDSLTVVKNPFLYGGMEYPALVYISDILNESIFTEVIIHEIAHQWWYAAVGNDQVREAWLDEGLAEYSTTIFYEHNPSYEVTKEARLTDTLRAYILYYERAKLLGIEDTSMNRSVAQFSTSAEYNVMTYVKGHLMLDGLRESIGDEAFFTGLKNYYKNYKFKRASTDDFIGAMESASKTQLKGYFDSWLLGKVKMFAS